MFDAIPILQLQDIVWLAGVGGIVVVTIIQNLSKTYKPWTWLAKQFGKAINSEMLEKLDDLDKKVEKIDSESNKEKALAARRRILRTADECRVKVKHSEEYFNNVLEDISFYKDYCNDNPKFENEKAVIAISIIEKAYRHAHETNDFL